MIQERDILRGQGGLTCRPTWLSEEKPINGDRGVIRHEETFVHKIESYCDGKDVLEVGCGDGARSREMARTCKSWIGIDSDGESIQEANQNDVPENTRFVECVAEDLKWPASTFEVVIFTLSLHHIEIEVMPAAVDEAIRVLRPEGIVIFMEPLPVGTFFDAEMRFGCCDGDERKKLAYASYVMLNSEKLTEIEEFIDRVSVRYDSFDDFLHNVSTREESHAKLERFLADLEFKLDEKFRMNAFRVSG